MIKRTNFDKIKIYLAVSSLLFALFNFVYSYGFMLVEYYRVFYPPEIWFGSNYNLYFDVLVRYIIISGCYFLYIFILTRKEKSIMNQTISFFVLLIMQYQIGFSSFIMGKVEIPGVSLMWTKEIFSHTFLQIINWLQFSFWLIGIILIVLQFVSLVRISKFLKFTAKT